MKCGLPVGIVYVVNFTGVARNDWMLFQTLNEFEYFLLVHACM